MWMYLHRTTQNSLCLSPPIDTSQKTCQPQCALPNVYLRQHKVEPFRFRQLAYRFQRLGQTLHQACRFALAIGGENIGQQAATGQPFCFVEEAFALRPGLMCSNVGLCCRTNIEL